MLTNKTQFSKENSDDSFENNSISMEQSNLRNKKLYGKSSFASKLFVILLIIVLPLAFYFYSESQDKLAKNKTSKKRPSSVVTIDFCKRQDIPLEIQAVGNVESMETVSVRSRVDGEIVEVLFKEGETIKKKQPLFKIDPRPFLESVSQAEANLAQNKADVLQQESMIAKSVAELRRLEANLESDNSKEKLAKRQLDRYADLVKQGAVSLEQEDQVRTNFESLNATLRASQAGIDNQKAVIESDRSKLLSLKARESSAKSILDQAKLNLSYCTIFSPMDGQAGSLLVHCGNMIKANDIQPLVVINKLNPIYVSFSLPEAELTQIKYFQHDTEKLPVDVSISASDAQDIVLSGKLCFMDNAVQTNTGTIKMKAIFDNSQKYLWPGQFANISLKLAKMKDVLTVPTRSLIVNQQGTFVYVVSESSAANLKKVQVLRRYKDLSIVRGLMAGEKVVTDGQMQLSPGSEVSITSTEKHDHVSVNDVTFSASTTKTSLNLTDDFKNNKRDSQ